MQLNQAVIEQDSVRHLETLVSYEPVRFSVMLKRSPGLVGEDLQNLIQPIDGGCDVSVFQPESRQLVVEVRAGDDRKSWMRHASFRSRVSNDGAVPEWISRFTWQAELLVSSDDQPTQSALQLRDGIEGSLEQCAAGRHLKVHAQQW